MVGAPPDVARAAAVLRAGLGPDPFDAALVLGSGLGGVAAAVASPRAVSFEAAGMPPAGVAGHAGGWVAGTLEGRRVLVQAGRYHLYEGHSLDVVRAPARILAALGVRRLILTNASGGIRPGFAPGTLMLLGGHLDLITTSALDLDVPATRAAARSDVWDGELAALARRCAAAEGIPLASGVYAALRGPSYETPAEIRMLARLGADAVGMSTVPEATAAAELGVRCLGLSLVTNHAAGIVSAAGAARSGTARSVVAHSEVVEAGLRAGPTLERLVRAWVRALPA